MYCFCFSLCQGGTNFGFMNGANELQPTTTSYGKYIKFKIVLVLQSPSFHNIIIFVPYLEKLPLKKTYRFHSS